MYGWSRTHPSSFSGFGVNDNSDNI